MCGRTCLTLDPNQILCACKQKLNKENASQKPISTRGASAESTGKYQATSESRKEEIATDDEDAVLPEWRAEFNCGRTYTPSYNIAPTDITPVMVSSDHFLSGSERSEKSKGQCRRVVLPMMWGMIPFWHKGDYRKHGLTTNNCRLEHMLESKLYGGPFRRGQRCVVVCEGFYEWQTTKSAKPSERAAFLLHMPQSSDVKIYDKATWDPENVRLLKMAGLFDIWESSDGDKMYSYSVITFESSKIMSWLHHRMPAILETDQQVDDWLDFKRVPEQDALTLLRPATELEWHRVSNLVNNSRNKSNQCNKPIELSIQPTMKSNTLLSWLNVRKKRSEESQLPVSDEENSVDCSTTTSSSETENPPKRMRYRDFKKAVTNARGIVVNQPVGEDKEKQQKLI